MFHNKIYLFLFLLLSKKIFSTTITGTYKPLANTHVYISICDDYFTETPTYIGETIADNYGTFHLNLKPLNGINKVWIKTSQYITFLYISNQGNYTIELSLPNSSNTVENKQFLYCKVLQGNDSINKEIKQIDSIFDNFYSLNYLKFIHPRTIKLVADTFKKKLVTIISSSPEFIKAYTHFALSTIDDASGMRESYFYNQYTNSSLSSGNLEAYYKYLKEHYKSYFEKIIAKPCFGDAQQIINEQHNCASIIDKITSCDTIIKTDSLRELLFCNGLLNLYYKREYKKPSIEMMLRYMAFNSKFITVKKVCKNILAKVTALSVGTPAPNLKLPSSNADSISLSSQKGKLVYLCFTNYSNLEWQTHLPIIERLQLLYDKRLQIITVTLLNDFSQMKAMQNQKLLSGIVLNGYDSFFLKNDFLIDSLPKYILIDEEGDVLKTTNCSPVDAIEEAIKAALKKK